MADNINSGAVDDLNDALRESRNLTKLISDNFAALEKAIGKVGNGGKKIVDNINEYAKALSKTASLTDKLAAGKLKEKDIIDQKIELEKKYAKFVDESNKTQLISTKKLSGELKESNRIQQSRAEQIKRSYEELDNLQTQLEREKANIINANNAIDKRAAKDRAKALREEIVESHNALTEQESIYKNAEKELIVKKQQLEKVKETNKANKELRALYEQQIKDLEALTNTLREQNTYGYALKKIYEGISDKIGDALKPMAVLTAAFEFLKKVAFATSDQVTKLQKSLLLTQDEAYAVRDNFQAMANASEDAFITTAKLLEANAALGKQLGFNSQFSSDLNTQFVKLTKQIGLSEEAAGGLAKLSKVTGGTLENTKNIALETSQRLSSQYGIQLDQKDVLEEIGKLSGQTLAMFKASPQALAEAVAQAKLLGTSLETTKKQASSLLNFESSIENELQAELLTGQQLNLERARTAALTGDLTTTMKELNSQNIDFNKFSNMNVIAQNKVAEALGLSSDELSDQLLKQQYLNMSREQVVALGGEEVAQRLEALNAQDKFNAAMEKLQDIVGTLIAGPLGKFVDMIASLASNSFALYSAITAIAGVSLAKTVASLGIMAAELWTSAVAGTTIASVLTLGLAGVGIAAGIAAVVGAMTTANSPSAGIVNTPDTTASIGDLQTTINQNRNMSTGGNSQETVNMLAKINDTMTSVNNNVAQLNNKEGTVTINGQKAGTAQLMGNYNLA
jgi:DNA repair exonuclease SbcCD ATPase subunit